MSYLVCNASDPSDISKILRTGDVIVKSDGFSIENDHIHGITYDRSMSEGVSFGEALERVLPHLLGSSYLFAHNAQFDINALKSEMFRYGYGEKIKEFDKEVNIFCTMNETKV